MVSALFCSFGQMAYADSSYFSVTLKNGETVCSVCKANGIDYSANKNLIMVLNGMTKEAELGALPAGSAVKLPTQAASNSNSIISGDSVKYYVLPYVIEKGDTIAHVYWLWGLRFENYAQDIMSLNYIDDYSDLDLLFVGNTYLLPTTEANVKTGTYTTVMSHVMQSGETVYDVCCSYGIDYNDSRKTLERYNRGADLTNVKVGQELLIPLL